MKPKDEKKIEDIYAATLQLVQEYGLSGITMSMIAKQASLATGTVYLYFTNKEELIVKLFDVCANNYIRMYYSGVDIKADFSKNFRTIWMNSAKYNIEHFDQMIFLEQCFHCPFIPEEIRAVTKERFKPWYDLLEKARDAGKIKNLETIWLICYVRGTIREMVKQSKYSGKKITQSIMDRTFEMCWNGLTS